MLRFHTQWGSYAVQKKNLSPQAVFQNRNTMDSSSIYEGLELQVGK